MQDKDKDEQSEREIYNAQFITKVEVCAAKVVRDVQTFVELIRKASPLKLPSQFSMIQSSGLSEVVRCDIIAKVTESCQLIDEELVDSSEARSLSLEIFQVSTDESQHEFDERQIVIHQIILPLFYSLWKCYSVLDRVPTRNSEKDTNGKPTPPPGMLSLQAYTDIAALLEFCTCTSIIPLLDSNILNTAEQRARLLPKSLAGRLPRTSLLWGVSALSSPSMLVPSSRSRELELTATLMGNLILLDRFRPMLLPRHLADLHAALFQAEHLSTTHSLKTPYTAIRSRLLPSPDVEVDSILLARSYQTLLLHGTLTPPWLRSLVSPLLTDLARHDLGSLIHVFVASAPKEHSGGASLRLARTVLMVAPCDETSTAYFKEICQQVVQLLIGIGDVTGGLSVQSMSVVQTVWALVDSLPLSMLQESLIGDSVVALQMARCLAALLSFVPPYANVDKFFRLILEVSPTTGLNLLGIVLSQASTPSILHSKAKEDALRALRSLLAADFIMQTKITTKTGYSLSGVELLAMALVHALASSGDGDLTEGGQEYSSREIDVSAISYLDDGATTFVIEGIAQRAKTLVGEILAPMLKRQATLENVTDHSELHSLSSNMLVILLDSYLHSAHHCSDPNYAVFSSRAFQYVPLVTLPILCEECPMESLLHSEGSTRIFELMAITFDSTAARLRRVDAECFPGQGDLTRTVDGHQSCLKEAFVSFLGPSLHQSTLETWPSSSIPTFYADDQMLFSICSVLLGVLIGILELGVTRRSAVDEEKLNSFPSKLLPLASISSAASSETVDGIWHAQVPPELANMASHASALILARQAPAAVDAQVDALQGKPRDRFAQIELDLKSSEVPIRARAVVSLRHVASALEDCSSADTLEADESALWRALSLALESLNDSESYVYLAAIQTIATLADFRPKEIIPAIAWAVSTGELKISKTSTSVILSPEQRVKLAEAIMFFIRRKAAIYECLPLLMNVMVYVGSSEAFRMSQDTSLLIQKTTHEYFKQGLVPNDEPHDLMKDEERWEEMDTRVNTGGPLFDSEEIEVVRAARLAVVTELVAAAEPSVLCRYCSILVSASMESLRLGVSRPIRRAGALLARELYAAVIREQGQQIPFAVAMVAAHEDWLAIALERCLSQEDLSDLGEDKERRGDPATDARCKEALSFRAEAEQILISGRLIHYSETASTSQPLLHMLQEPSRDKESYNSAVKHIIEEL